MKRRALTLLIIIAMCASPLAVFAEEDICYENPLDYDEWGDPTTYGAHSWSYDYSEDATCEDWGYEVYTCDYCYDTMYVDIPPTGHDWSGPEYVDSPSRYDTLIWGMECVNDDCGKTKYAPIKIKKGKKKRVISKQFLKRLKKLTNKKIKWSSSKKKVATVSNGVVKAKKKGTAYIKAKIWIKKYKTWIYIKYKVVVR